MTTILCVICQREGGKVIEQLDRLASSARRTTKRLEGHRLGWDCVSPVWAPSPPANQHQLRWTVGRLHSWFGPGVTPSSGVPQTVAESCTSDRQSFCRPLHDVSPPRRACWLKTVSVWLSNKATQSTVGFDQVKRTVTRGHTLTFHTSCQNVLYVHWTLQIRTMSCNYQQQLHSVWIPSSRLWWMG